MSAPHDRPDIAELVEAVREFLERDVFGATEGRVQFLTRVAINALNIVGRELQLGPEQQARHEAGLRQLGMRSDRELAQAIRDGRLDSRLDEVTAVVYESVRDKLQVANPGYAGFVPRSP